MRVSLPGSQNQEALPPHVGLSILPEAANMDDRVGLGLVLAGFGCDPVQNLPRNACSVRL